MASDEGIPTERNNPEPALTDLSERLMLMLQLTAILVAVVLNLSEQLTTSPSCGA